MHAQHFVDNQTIHHSHRSSPFVFRSQVVYRHTVPAALGERTLAFCVGRMPVWVNRDRGGASRLRPSHTTVHAGPHTAVRRVELSPDSQSRNPKRVEVSIRQRNPKCRTIRQPSRTVIAPRRLSGEVFAHAPFPQFWRIEPVPASTASRSQTVACAWSTPQDLATPKASGIAKIADPSAKILAQLLGH